MVVFVIAIAEVVAVIDAVKLAVTTKVYINEHKRASGGQLGMQALNFL